MNDYIRTDSSTLARGADGNLYQLTDGSQVEIQKTPIGQAQATPNLEAIHTTLPVSASLNPDGRVVALLFVAYTEDSQ